MAAALAPVAVALAVGILAAAADDEPADTRAEACGAPALPGSGLIRFE